MKNEPITKLSILKHELEKTRFMQAMIIASRILFALFLIGLLIYAIILSANNTDATVLFIGVLIAGIISTVAYYKVINDTEDYCESVKRAIEKNENE